VRQLYGSNMKSVSPVHLYLTGLGTSGRVYRECVRQSLDFDKLMVSDLLDKWLSKEKVPFSVGMMLESMGNSDVLALGI